MSAVLRAAVIGAGFVGAQHIDALRRIGVEVAVVAASSGATAATSASAAGVDRSTGDWHAAVADPAVDVVHVCVPNDLHGPVVLASLRAGKHVICEKPLAMDLAEADELVEAAETSDRVAVLCHNYRFFPMAAELRLRVAGGELGALHLVRGSYLQDWLLAPEATNWRIDPARGGRSRTIADIGTHVVDLAETVIQRRLVAVMAQTSTVHERRADYRHVRTFTAPSSSDGAGWLPVRTEDQAGMLLRFEGDLLGTLSLSQVAAGHANDLELSVDGAAGSATWRQEEPDRLWLAHDGRSEIVARSPDRLGAGAGALARLPGGHNEGWGDALRNLLAAAYDEIRGGRDAAAADAAPLPTFADGRRHLAFVEAALRSADEQRWVRVDEVLAEHRRVPERS
jgi:predicted dehydrogenase